MKKERVEQVVLEGAGGGVWLRGVNCVLELLGFLFGIVLFLFFFFFVGVCVCVLLVFVFCGLGGVGCGFFCTVCVLFS